MAKRKITGYCWTPCKNCGAEKAGYCASCRKIHCHSCGRGKHPDCATMDAQDEIWLSHLRPNAKKWIALAGDYPHTLVGVGADAVEASNAAKANGHDDATLFYVPDPTVRHIFTPLMRS